MNNHPDITQLHRTLTSRNTLTVALPSPSKPYSPHPHTHHITTCRAHPSCASATPIVPQRHRFPRAPHTPSLHDNDLPT
jgi:hypothetical protein